MKIIYTPPKSTEVKKKGRRDDFNDSLNMLGSLYRLMGALVGLQTALI